MEKGVEEYRAGLAAAQNNDKWQTWRNSSIE
jgi:hypothetical protein